jgi:hypothetical protein
MLHHYAICKKKLEFFYILHVCIQVHNPRNQQPTVRVVKDVYDDKTICFCFIL